MKVQDRELLFSILTKLGCRVKREDIDLTLALQYINQEAVPHSALHFTGKMRDYYRVKWQLAANLTNEEAEKVLAKNLSGKDKVRKHAKDYLNAKGVPIHPNWENQK